MKNAMITGVSSGLGLGFARALLQADYKVFGVSRRGADLDHDHLRQMRADLSVLERIGEHMDGLLGDTRSLDLVVLNAGILGGIQSMQQTSIDDLKSIMTINVWSNKVLLDRLIAKGIDVDTVLLISSGAAVRGSFGWSGYALSKAALNMLTQLYAHEMLDTRLIALAPGLVDTAMQDVLCEEVDEDRFPSVSRLKQARGTAAMPSPDETALHILDLMPKISQLESGTFVDVRDLQ